MYIYNTIILMSEMDLNCLSNPILIILIFNILPDFCVTTRQASPPLTMLLNSNRLLALRTRLELRSIADWRACLAMSQPAS